MKKIFLLIAVCAGTCLKAQKVTPTDLRTGDLLFQDLDCGPMCDAIEAVTRGVKRRSFSHVGIVEMSGSGCYVWESSGPGVRRVVLDSFRKKTAHAITVGRVKSKYRQLLPLAIDFIRGENGVGYDKEFIYNNGTYYCSELIYEAFKVANEGRPFFSLYPMTFKKPGSSAFFPVWVSYYEKLQKPVPEGMPGCNPGGLSRSGRILILGEL